MIELLIADFLDQTVMELRVVETTKWAVVNLKVGSCKMK